MLFPRLLVHTTRGYHTLQILQRCLQPSSAFPPWNVVQTFYTITHEAEETPPFLCFSCFQGSHNCSQISEKLRYTANVPLGFVWLCHGCKAKINPVNPPKRTRTASVSHTPSGANTPKQNTQPPLLKEDDLQQRLSNIDRGGEEQTEHTNANGRGDSTKVCPRYKTRNCPHGNDGK